MKLQFTGIPGNPYQLQSVTNLFPPVLWLPVLTRATDTNGRWQFTHTNAIGDRKFYRVLAQ